MSSDHKCQKQPKRQHDLDDMVEIWSGYKSRGQAAFESCGI